MHFSGGYFRQGYYLSEEEMLSGGGEQHDRSIIHQTRFKNHRTIIDR